MKNNEETDRITSIINGKSDKETDENTFITFNKKKETDDLTVLEDYDSQ